MRFAAHVVRGPVMTVGSGAGGRAFALFESRRGARYLLRRESRQGTIDISLSVERRITRRARSMS